MVRKRALEDGDTVAVNGKLPVLYSGVAPINPTQHGDLCLSSHRDFQFASAANAVPIVADEFTQVARHYPIVFSLGALPMPVALVGFTNGKNDHVNEDGSWSEGHYVPSYLRRYPFMLLQESDQSDRKILCADLSSTLFQSESDGAEPLFDDAGNAAGPIVRSLEFCNRFEASMARTRSVMKELAELDVFQESSVTIKRGGFSAQIDGFVTISEEKLRARSDLELAGLTRRGVMTLIAAHHISVTNFAQMEHEV